jgi:hypothetical protein
LQVRNEIHIKPLNMKVWASLEVLTWMNVHRPNMSVIYDK